MNKLVYLKMYIAKIQDHNVSTINLIIYIIVSLLLLVGRMTQSAVTLASALMVVARFPLYVGEASGSICVDFPHHVLRISFVFTIPTKVAFSSALYICCSHSSKSVTG